MTNNSGKVPRMEMLLGEQRVFFMRIRSVKSEIVGGRFRVQLPLPICKNYLSFAVSTYVFLVEFELRILMSSKIRITEGEWAKAGMIFENQLPDGHLCLSCEFCSILYGASLQ